MNEVRDCDGGWKNVCCPRCTFLWQVFVGYSYGRPLPPPILSVEIETHKMCLHSRSYSCLRVILANMLCTRKLSCDLQCIDDGRRQLDWYYYTNGPLALGHQLCDRDLSKHLSFIDPSSLKFLSVLMMDLYDRQSKNHKIQSPTSFDHGGSLLSWCW